MYWSVMSMPAVTLYYCDFLTYSVEDLWNEWIFFKAEPPARVYSYDCDTVDIFLLL